MSKREDNLLGEMPVPKAIFKIGVPAMAAMLVMAVYNLVDTLFIGMLGDDKALSAVAVAFPIMTLMGAVGQVFGAGAAAAIGRAFGVKDHDYANRIATTTIYTSLVSGVIFAIFGILFIEEIFTAFGTTQSVMGHAVDYGIWMFVGAVFSIPNQAFNNIARAETKAVLSMKALSIGSVANIILDPIFMFELGGFGLNMGIEGASIATTISQGLCFLFIGWHFFTGKTTVKIKPSNFNPNKSLYKEVVSTGAPIGLSQMLSTLAVSITNIAAISFSVDLVYGENIQSAYGIVLKFTMMIFMVFMGLLQGFQPIASFSYGSRNKERFYEAFTFTRKLLLVSSAVIGLIMLVFAPMFISAFTQNPEIIDMGSKFIRANGICLPLLGIAMLQMLTFQATGNGRYGSIVATARQGYIYIPLLFILAATVGISTIFYIQAISDLSAGIISMILYTKYKKTLEAHFNSVD